MNQVKLGVIGAGYISHFHLETFRDMNDVSVVAICNRGEEKRKKIASEFNIPHQYADYAIMLKEQKLDAVLLCVSVENMASVILGCIPSKIPLLVEKPVALSVAEAEKIAAEVKKHGTKVMVGCNRRFMSTVRRAKEAAEQNGGVTSIFIEANERMKELEQDPSVKKEVLDKWIYANGIHCIDLLQYFCGKAKSVQSRSRPAEKNYDALVDFTNGVTGHYLSYRDVPSKWTVALNAKEAKITIKPLEFLRIEKRGEEAKEFGLDETDMKYKPGFFRQNRYFIDCVKSGKEFSHPACGMDEALEVMKLIEMIERR